MIKIRPEITINDCNTCDYKDDDITSSSCSGCKKKTSYSNYVKCPSEKLNDFLKTDERLEGAIIDKASILNKTT